MCGRPKMAHSVTDGWGHDEGRVGRSVTGVQTGKQNKSVTGSMEM